MLFLFFREQSTVKQLLHYLKYKNQPQISSFLGEWCASILVEEGIQDKFDVVVPVPLHPKKQKKRGYNQVDGFAKSIATALHLEFLSDALIKTANTRTQTKQNRFMRWKQVQSLYKGNPKHQLNQKRVLLVDDVVTTGATLEACAEALHKMGNNKIYIMTMAVVPNYGI